MTESFCYLCKYYLIIPEDVSRGSCRRFPPIVYPVKTNVGQSAYMNIFPTVEKNWWCGEYFPKVGEV